MDLPMQDNLQAFSDVDLSDAIVRLSNGFRQLKGIGLPTGTSSADIEFDEWDWEVGVGLYGDFRQAESRSDTEALLRIARWYERQLSKGLPRRQVNSTAPMLTMALLSDALDRTDWHDTIAQWAQWQMDEMLKTEEGGFQHTVKERDNDHQLWDDTLIMAVLFLAVAGKILKRQDWIDEAHYQFLVHIRYLGDVESGLFFHGWNFIGRHHYARALWARGNAWITMAIPEIMRLVPPPPVISRYLSAVFNTQVSALARLQGEDGLFHTLLDDPSSPVEASGTAGIAYGVLSGIQLELIGGEYNTLVCRALAGVLDRIDAQGLLQDVSDGTPMGDDLEFYRRIRNVPTPYGQALASLFLIEARQCL